MGPGNLYFQRVPQVRWMRSPLWGHLAPRHPLLPLSPLCLAPCQAGSGIVAEVRVNSRGLSGPHSSGMQLAAGEQCPCFNHYSSEPQVICCFSVITSSCLGTGAELSPFIQAFPNTCSGGCGRCPALARTIWGVFLGEVAAGCPLAGSGKQLECGPTLGI